MSKTQTKAEQHHKKLKQAGGKMPSEDELKKQAQEKALDDDYESVQKIMKDENDKES